MNNICMILIPSIIQIITLFYFIFVFTTCFTKESYTIKKHILNLIISIILISSGNLTKSLFPLNLIIVMILMFFSLIYVFKLKKELSIFIIFIFPITMILCELITASVFMNILNASAEHLRNDCNLYTLVILFQSLLFLFFTYLIIKLINNKPTIKNIFQRIDTKYIKIFLFLTLVTILPTLILIILKKYEFSPLFIFTNALQLAIISVFIFVYMKKIIEHEITQKERDIVKLDNKTLTDMVDRCKNY